MSALKHAREWQECVDEEVAKRSLDAAAGHSTAANDNRIALYRKVVSSYELEHETGKPHCINCLKPVFFGHVCF